MTMDFLSSGRNVVLESSTWGNLNDLSYHFNMSEDDVIDLAIKTLAYMAVKMNEGQSFFVETEPGVVVPLALPTKKREIDE